MLDFDAGILHPEQAARRWISKVKIQPDTLEIDDSSESLVLVGTEDLVGRLVAHLDAKNGPDHLLWALVPDGNGGLRRIPGEAYESHLKVLESSRGRTTLLNALPSELGPRYWASMTHPDYARDD
jgi:hypothetical protein